jgi:hypothetical protein
VLIIHGSAPSPRTLILLRDAQQSIKALRSYLISGAEVWSQPPSSISQSELWRWFLKNSLTGETGIRGFYKSEEGLFFLMKTVEAVLPPPA